MAGGGLKKDIDNIQYLSENMLGQDLLPLGGRAAMPTIAFVKNSARNLKTTWKASRAPSRKKERA